MASGVVKAWFMSYRLNQAGAIKKRRMRRQGNGLAGFWPGQVVHARQKLAGREGCAVQQDF
jgi:hypothetical protein